MTCVSVEIDLPAEGTIPNPLHSPRCDEYVMKWINKCGLFCNAINGVIMSATRNVHFGSNASTEGTIVSKKNFTEIYKKIVDRRRVYAISSTVNLKKMKAIWDGKENSAGKTETISIQEKYSKMVSQMQRNMTQSIITSSGITLQNLRSQISKSVSQLTTQLTHAVSNIA